MMWQSAHALTGPPLSGASPLSLLGCADISCRSYFQSIVAKIYKPSAFTASLRTSAMPITAFYKSPAMTDLSRIQGPSSAVVPSLEGRFYRPPLPDGYVLRPRLCERLSAGLDGRLLLVSAPAGFGKSSLAVEFCQVSTATACRTTLYGRSGLV